MRRVCVAWSGDILRVSGVGRTVTNSKDWRLIDGGIVLGEEFLKPGS